MAEVKLAHGQTLREIEERAEKATKGEWYTSTLPDGVYVVVGEYGKQRLVCRLSDDIWREVGPFIAHARTDVPDLIAHIRHLEGVIDALQKSSR